MLNFPSARKIFFILVVFQLARTLQWMSWNSLAWNNSNANKPDASRSLLQSKISDNGLQKPNLYFQGTFSAESHPLSIHCLPFPLSFVPLASVLPTTTNQADFLLAGWRSVPSLRNALSPASLVQNQRRGNPHPQKPVSGTKQQTWSCRRRKLTWPGRHPHWAENERKWEGKMLFLLSDVCATASQSVCAAEAVSLWKSLLIFPPVRQRKDLWPYHWPFRTPGPSICQLTLQTLHKSCPGSSCETSI